MSSVGDIQSVPGELFAKFQTSFYADPVDAVYKALGVDWEIGRITDNAYTNQILAEWFKQNLKQDQNVDKNDIYMTISINLGYNM